MKIRFTTTNSLFCIGFAWNNPITHEYKAVIIIGFIGIEFYWKKEFNKN